MRKQSRGGFGKRKDHKSSSSYFRGDFTGGFYDNEKNHATFTPMFTSLYIHFLLGLPKLYKYPRPRLHSIIWPNGDYMQNFMAFEDHLSVPQVEKVRH